MNNISVYDILEKVKLDDTISDVINLEQYIIKYKKGIPLQRPSNTLTTTRDYKSTALQHLSNHLSYHCNDLETH